jgi:hypothetical protein
MLDMKQLNNFKPCRCTQAIQGLPIKKWFLQIKLP